MKSSWHLPSFFLFWLLFKKPKVTKLSRESYKRSIVEENFVLFLFINSKVFIVRKRFLSSMNREFFFFIRLKNTTVFNEHPGLLDENLDSREQPLLLVLPFKRGSSESGARDGTFHSKNVYINQPLHNKYFPQQSVVIMNRHTLGFLFSHQLFTVHPLTTQGSPFFPQQV